MIALHRRKRNLQLKGKDGRPHMKNKWLAKSHVNIKMQKRISIKADMYQTCLSTR